MTRFPATRFPARTILFLAAFAGMALEIAASRRYAPMIGTGIDAWAAVIATALGGFAIGHTIAGGLMARGRSPQMVAGIGLTGIAVMASLESSAASLLLADGAQRVVGYAAMVGLFGLVSIATGMVGPAAAQIALGDGPGRERRVATVFTLGALGSIGGTLAAGFVLLPYLGLTYATLTVAGLAALMCLAIRQRLAVVVAATALVIAVTIRIWGDDALCQRATSVQCLAVLDDQFDGRAFKWLVADGIRQSTIPVDETTPLTEYVAEAVQQTASAVSRFEAPRILEIGGAGMAFSITVARDFPAATVMTAEIDRDATEYVFELGAQRLPNHSVVPLDGRVFLQEDQPAFDAVLVDAFRSRNVPAHLVSQGFYADLRRRLGRDGFVLVNVIDGGELRLARAIAKTADTVFPQRVNLWGRREPEEPDNYIITINARQTPSEFPVSLSWDEQTPVFTDDWAPVERMIY